MKFRIIVLPVKDGNGYIAQCGTWSFWDRTRIAVIIQMTERLAELIKHNKSHGH